VRGSLLRYVVVKLTRAGASRMGSRRVCFGNRMLGLGTWFALLHHITTTPTPTYIPFPSLPPRFPALRLPLPRPLPPLSSFLLSPPSLPSPPSPPPSLALCPPPPALTLARRVEGVCYFLASPDGASSPHAAKFKSAIQMIVDKVEKMQQPDGYMDIYFTVVDPEGRFQNLRDMHEMCQCSLFLGLCNRWLYLADGT